MILFHCCTLQCSKGMCDIDVTRHGDCCQEWVMCMIGNAELVEIWLNQKAMNGTPDSVA